MKKFLALVAGLIFVLGLSTMAFAVVAEIPADTQAVIAKGTTQITLGGEIRARGEIREVDFNSDMHLDGPDPGTAVGNSRDEDASYYDGRIRLSVDAQVTPNTKGFIQVEAGNGPTSDNYTWGAGGDGARGAFTKGNSKRGQFNILQAWIEHKGTGLLGIPASIKIGHMPLALGNKLFFDHTKFGDDAIFISMDPTKELNIGLHTIKFNEGDNGISDDADAYGVLFGYKLPNGSISGDVTYVDDRAYNNNTNHYAHIWNIGLRGTFNLDMITLRADIEKQLGTIDEGATEYDITGWAFLAGADIKVDPLTLTLEFAYGSGDDDPTDDEINNFLTSLGADVHFTYVYEYSTINACGDLSGGLCNTMYVKLGASAKPIPNLTASLDLYWLRAIEDFGPGNDSDIGIEIDPKISYQLDKNLRYFIEGGYLIAGDAWGNNADDAWAFRHGIVLSF
ncbi:MAG: alginate export family protein [Thermodesulfovibrionales bacterium]|nr:alginate export family protein [Thermodesulfovibrionales bacterium]